ncbi:molybdopterin-containing oxidoreductase family protein [Deferrisoma camini]|uniref:molybdopterin-containing oxidoreductase family protein n=1 Tax=Deferrisoma camini TaxID=1035120 RepID=UPI00046D8250|nr:molybdopterin-dependent oxidoreductase [Deferrisoma camini]
MAGLTRRQFLEWGGAGAAGLALAGPAAGALPAPAHRSLRKFRDPVATACTACGGTCAVRVFRNGGLPVQVLPNPEAGTLSGICPRAFGALESFWDPNRLTRPLRRKGRRGAGEFEEISWDEAVEAVAQTLAEAPDRAYVDVGRPDPLAGAMLERLGVTRRIAGPESTVWSAREAQRRVYGLPLASPDLSRVRTLVLVGARPWDQGPAFGRWAQGLAELRARGGRIISLGSFEGATGSVADEWIPIRPGSECLVLLGILRVLLTQGGYEAEGFVQRVGVEPEKILESLVPYSVDLVEAASGLSALTLVRLAQAFRAGAPSLCWVDSAGTPQAEALEATAAVLNASQGDPEAAGLRLAHPLGWVPAFEPTLPRTRAVKDLLAGNEGAGLYLAYRANPVYESPRSRSVHRAFAEEDRIGLVVAFDTHLTETAQVADLVLPAASDLELWNLVGGYDGDGKAWVALQQPAPRGRAEPEWLRRPDTAPDGLFDGPRNGPVGEARQLGDLLLAVGRRIGGGLAEAFPYPDAGTYVRYLCDTLPPLAADGGFRALAARGVWRARRVGYPWAATHGFPTPSRTLEVTHRLKHRVPRDLKRLEGEHFALVVVRHPETDPAFPRSARAGELHPENPLLLHPEAAAALGLHDGAEAVVRTEVGEARVRVQLVRGIHPRAAALAWGYGHPPRQDDRPWWAVHGPGVSVAELSPFATDSEGAQAWKALRITVAPA